jgi:hypothetical protein
MRGGSEKRSFFFQGDPPFFMAPGLLDPDFPERVGLKPLPFPDGDIQGCPEKLKLPGKGRESNA